MAKDMQVTNVHTMVCCICIFFFFWPQNCLWHMSPNHRTTGASCYRSPFSLFFAKYVFLASLSYPLSLRTLCSSISSFDQLHLITIISTPKQTHHTHSLPTCAPHTCALVTYDTSPTFSTGHHSRVYCRAHGQDHRGSLQPHTGYPQVLPWRLAVQRQRGLSELPRG